MTILLWSTSRRSVSYLTSGFKGESFSEGEYTVPLSMAENLSFMSFSHFSGSSLPTKNISILAVRSSSLYAFQTCSDVRASASERSPLTGMPAGSFSYITLPAFLRAYERLSLISASISSISSCFFRANCFSGNAPFSDTGSKTQPQSSSSTEADISSPSSANLSPMQLADIVMVWLSAKRLIPPLTLAP